MNFLKDESLNVRIKKLRKKKGYTQLELAERVRVTDKAVSKWETGDGNPELTILIELSNIFDVSLDYLLTGKERESTVIVTSKMELSCKKDDIALFKTINSDSLNSKDENGKYFIDYLDEFYCPNVYKSYIESIKLLEVFNSYNRNRDQILKLMFKYDDVSSLHKIGFFNHNLKRDMFGYIEKSTNNYNIYNINLLEPLLPLLSNCSLIWTEIFSIHKNNIKNSVVNWQAIYIMLFQYLISVNNEELIEKIATLIVSINEISVNLRNLFIENYENGQDMYSNNKYSSCYCLKENHPKGRLDESFSVVAVPTNIIETLLNKGIIDVAIKLNNFNKLFGSEYVTDGIIDSVKMKLDGKSTDDDIFITSCMEFGIVNIDKLLKCNDYKIIKYAFENYPMTFQELLEYYYNNKKFKELYEFSVDNNYYILANSLLLNCDNDDITNAIKYTYLSVLSGEIGSNKYKFNINLNYYKKNGYSINNIFTSYRLRLLNLYELKKRDIDNINFVYEKLSEKLYKTEDVKNDILINIKLKLDKDKVSKNLSKEKLLILLNSQNIELLIINLCVKLEAILKCDYKYHGTFEEMLKQFCDNELNWEEDDGWGYMVNECDRKTIDVLQNLRLKRNSIVHAENVNVNLTVEELKYCIEYICNLDKENN